MDKLLLEHLALLAAAQLCRADCVEADGSCDSCGVVNRSIMAHKVGRHVRMGVVQCRERHTRIRPCLPCS